MIAIGGGITGDLVGFVASIFKRGLNFISIPTTLLSQVDAAVGGKTGINSSYGKNLIGSFSQPKLVISDTSFLKSLKKLSYLNEQIEQCGTKGMFSIRRMVLFVKLGVCFARLFFMKSLVNKLPEDFRVKPSW